MSIIEIKKDPPYILHLDQNKWIELANIYYKSNLDENKKEILLKIDKLVDLGKLIVPINHIHIMELSKITDSDRRKSLSDFMLRISKEHVCTAYLLDPFLDAELNNYINSKRGETNNIINLREKILGFGMLTLMGRHIEYKGNVDITQLINKTIGLKKIFDDLLDSERGFMMQFEDGIRRSLPRINEGIQHDIDATKNKGKVFRKRLILAKYIYQFLIPKIKNYCDKTGFNEGELCKILFNDLKQEQSWEEFFAFFKNLPSTYTFFCLEDGSTTPGQHQRNENDSYDIHSLTLSIPYFDFVVAERFFISVAKRRHLDRLYKTTLLTKIEDLEPYLDNIMIQ